MASFIEFLASVACGAAICTAAIAIVARPLSARIKQLVYPTAKPTRAYTVSASS